MLALQLIQSDTYNEADRLGRGFISLAYVTPPMND